VDARILLLDLETAPNVGYVWGKYDQNVIKFVRSWFILCVGYKWLGDKDVRVFGLPDYGEHYRAKPEDDSLLVQDLWTLFNQADIIVAHNGDAFDIKRSNARFITHELQPPSTYKTVDTLKIARKHFKFESNRLTDLGEYLGLGGKASTGGFKLWEDCLDGDPEAWEKMKGYNARDVQLLEDIYLKLRPWAASHPDLNMWSEVVKDDCPKCGSHETEKRGYSYARTQTRQRHHCLSCGAWYSGKIVKK
jgi:hypothetical protein